jgi:undecaprenyl-diphosphatase
VIDIDPRPAADPGPVAGPAPAAASRSAVLAARLGGRTRATWCGVLLAGFVVLLWQVRTGGAMTAVDARVRAHVLAFSGAPGAHGLDQWAHWFADLGDTVPAIPVLVAIGAGFALWRRSLRPALAAALALAVLGGVVVPAKLLIARPGPGTAALPGHHLGYFPSGHTADAMMCYGAAALIAAAGCSPVVRRAIGATVGLLIALIGVALVWSDYHWTSDVLGSLALCGAALSLIALTLPGAGPAPTHRVAGPPVGGTRVRQDG